MPCFLPYFVFLCFGIGLNSPETLVQVQQAKMLLGHLLPLERPLTCAICGFSFFAPGMTTLSPPELAFTQRLGGNQTCPSSSIQGGVTRWVPTLQLDTSKLNISHLQKCCLFSVTNPFIGSSERSIHLFSCKCHDLDFPEQCKWLKLGTVQLDCDMEFLLPYLP